MIRSATSRVAAAAASVAVSVWKNSFDILMLLTLSFNLFDWKPICFYILNDFWQQNFIKKDYFLSAKNKMIKIFHFIFTL